MTWFEIAAIVLAGFGAGMINTIVGSGTLITFPVLLFFGYSPVVANVSNSLGLVFGSLTGAWGYRREIRPIAGMLKRLIPMTVLGSIIGALLLLVLPPEAFATIVPVLIALALLLVVLGPRLNRWAAKQEAEALTPGRWIALMAGVLFAGMYGGYFGAAQGVLMIGLMSVLLPLGIQQINGLKNVLVMIANLVAVIVFLIVSPELVNWWVALCIGVGAFLGGFAGARVGRILPPNVLRGIIVVIGLIAIVNLLV
ncbi:sulfite exporter TauE/SafE family protein [Ornithinimicrobium sp. Y1847]|uniref:sulfite exporter TauE/SafE family protein n=1 Tax=unclassified Ornithinimicrobium TaxID=2615080 RepID=UPI003B66D4E7